MEFDKKKIKKTGKQRKKRIKEMIFLKKYGENRVLQSGEI